MYDNPENPPFDNFGEDPHMWSYWTNRYFRLDDVLEEYYPRTLANLEELRVLFYVYRATLEKSIEVRIHEIMSLREARWKEAARDH